MPPWAWFLAAAAVAVAGSVGSDAPALVRAAMSNDTPQKALALALAQQWGPIFGCPVETIMAIAKIESGYRPGSVELSVRALTRDGAWGMMQQTLATAKGNVAALKKHPNALVQAAIARFDGTGESLLDPNLNVCLGAYQLGKLTAEFGDFVAVAAAYHQGAGKVRSMLRAGQAITAANLTASGAPKGAVYVTRAIKAREGIA